jgi:micrococcal nuclease
MGPWLKKMRFLLASVGTGLVLAALGLLLYGPSFDVLDVQEPSTPLDASTEMEEVVERVIDGDTVELSNGMRVRYIGVDTPEIRQHINGQWTYRPQRLAEEARAFNQSLVEGKKIRLVYDEERADRYHRQLAYVFVEDLFVNAEMIRSGYARVFIHSPNLKYSSLFLKLQRQARNQQKGVWSPGRKAWQENLPAGQAGLSAQIPANEAKMLAIPEPRLSSPLPVGTVH